MLKGPICDSFSVIIIMGLTLKAQSDLVCFTEGIQLKVHSVIWFQFLPKAVDISA